MRLSRLGILGVAIVVFSPFVGSAQNMPVSAASTCVSITQNLSFGSRGSDVIQLQQYLISQGLLAADSATGYFGKLTEAAVQQWQSSHGLVSSGTVATTGYGAVGPKTRAAIAASTCSTTSPTASSGTAGQAANPIQSAIDALLAQIHVLQDQINRLTSANTNTNPVTNTGTNSNTVSFSATPSSGTAPLTVSFQGNGGGRSYFGGARIDFGDGTSAVFCNQGSFCGSNIASHTYNTAGTYMATLTGVGEGNNVALGSVRINASASDISTTVASCTFNGATIAHGSSVTAYQSSSDHLMCRSQTRTCNSGTLSGSYTYSSCTVLPPSTHTCTFNGATIAHGASVTAYQSATVPSGSACSPQTRTCTNGTLSGSYAYSSCTVLPPRCTFNDNPIASGSSVTAYQSSHRPIRFLMQIADAHVY